MGSVGFTVPPVPLSDILVSVISCLSMDFSAGKLILFNVLGVLLLK